jgi:hypothetical protein
MVTGASVPVRSWEVVAYCAVHLHLLSLLLLLWARSHRHTGPTEPCWILHAAGVFRENSFHELVATHLKLVEEDTIQLVSPTI